MVNESSHCVGVIAQDGTKHFADRVIIAAGAWTPTLIDLKGQCVSKVSVLQIRLACPRFAR